MPRAVVREKDLALLLESKLWPDAHSFGDSRGGALRWRNTDRRRVRELPIDLGPLPAPLPADGAATLSPIRL